MHRLRYGLGIRIYILSYGHSAWVRPLISALFGSSGLIEQEDVFGIESLHAYIRRYPSAKRADRSKN